MEKGQYRHAQFRTGRQSNCEQTSNHQNRRQRNRKNSTDWNISFRGFFHIQNTHIGVEMCEPSCIKYTGGATFTCSDPAAAKAAVTRTYNAAVELFAMLCKQFGLDPMKDGVILSHKEGCARGIASNHGDPEHLWNQLGTGYTMNGFRAAVKAAMGAGGVTTPGTPAKPTTAPETGKLTPYKVRITATDLNIRAGARTNYPSKGYIKPGVYTIVEEATGKGAIKWGKLKSGAGWISLDYAKRL